MKNNKYIGIIFCLINFTIFSQIKGLTDINSDYYNLRVKTPEEFMMRFNYEQAPDGRTLKYNDSLKNKRLILVQSLFDSALLKKAQKNDTLAKNITGFVKETVVDTTQFLSYYSNKWIAQVECNVLYKNNKKKLTLLLKTEVNKNKESKWVIIDSHSEIFNMSAQNSTKIIGPISHNLNFMELPKMSRRYHESVINFKSKDFKMNNLSVFYFLIHSGDLKIENIEEIIFHYNQIRGFYFKIENIIRESSNSGWLITEIYRVKED